MNCYNHIDQPAVGTCIDCGKGLCSECSNKYNIFICDSCNLKRLYTEKSSIATRWGISIAIAVLFTLINFEILPKDFLIYLIMLPAMIICVFIISISIQYGWRALNSVMPPVSFVVSFFIGLISTPIMLFKDIKRYKEVNRTIKYISKG